MLTLIGVGPGDPELLTLKALRLIREADLIALADSGAGGSVVEGILGDLIAGKALLRLPMPMRGGREDWAQAHDAAARLLAERLEEGANIAWPVLGDPLLYATGGYVLARLGGRSDVAVVPGVPAMCAAAAAAKLPLAEADEPLTVLPGLKPGQALPEGNVVVMKAARALGAIATQAGRRRCAMLRNLGMPGEYVGPVDGAAGEGSGYFTTVIVKGR